MASWRRGFAALFVMSLAGGLLSGVSGGVAFASSSFSERGGTNAAMAPGREVSAQARGHATRVAPSCGYQVTTSIILVADVGPCPPGTDGLDIVANGVSVYLNHHTVTGSDTTSTSPAEQVGVNFKMVNGSALKGPGTVQDFDAGVAINGGSDNTVTRVLAQYNINHQMLTGADDPCNYGDGIMTDNSTGNLVSASEAIHNGPFDGLGLVDVSTGNRLVGNRVLSNDVANTLPSGEAGSCGPFYASSPVGRVHQDIGVRIEGPGAEHNLVQGNNVADNELAGIAVFGNMCNPENAPPGAGLGLPPTLPNNYNSVVGNFVDHNGYAGPGEVAEGISIFEQGPIGTVTCASTNDTIVGNASVDNAGDGVFVSPLSHNDVVSRNVVIHNGYGCAGAPADSGCVPGNGVHVGGPFTSCSSYGPNFSCNNPNTSFPGATDNVLVGNQGYGNASHDGDDDNPNCDNNLWAQNHFGTVNQACVAANGGSGTVTP